MKGVFKLSLKSTFLQSIPLDFNDPVTGLRAQYETELSALLCHYHMTKCIDWDRVNLYPIRNLTKRVSAAEYLDSSLPVFCEYPLFSNSETVDIWGQMPADLLSFSVENSRIVLIENKIGSKFTSGGTQLERQAEYLKRSRLEDKTLVVLSSKVFFDKGWYLNETLDVHQKIKGINIFTMHWEEIFAAITFKR